MSALPLNIQALFASLPDEVKNASPQQFQQGLDALPIPRPIKAQLWDMRFAAPPPDPQRFTESPGVPPSVEATPRVAQSVDPAPAPQTAMDLPVTPLRRPPQPAQSIGPLPPVTGASEVAPPVPKPPQGAPVNVPMAATPALNATGPTSSPIYQQVANIARTNPSFGASKLQRETGASREDISAALERLVGEGAIKRTQNARQHVVYHALPQQSETY